MSAKAVELMKEEMEYMGQVKVKDVSNAQRLVVDVLRALDEKGVVNLSGGESGEDAYVS
jgi:flagellar motor switch protein FliG